MPFSPENIAIHKMASYLSPEKLVLLKRVFDTSCEEAAIPQDAKAERNHLAQTLLTAGLTVDRESELLAAARKAVASYRRLHPE